MKVKRYLVRLDPDIVFYLGKKRGVVVKLITLLTEFSRSLWLIFKKRTWFMALIKKRTDDFLRFDVAVGNMYGYEDK